MASKSPSRASIKAPEVSFGNPAFVRNLRRTIARDYTLHLNRGLQIAINGEAVEGLPIELRRSDEFAPVRVEYKDQAGEGEVMVEIIGGMAAPPPEGIDPDDAEDGDKRFGWYVACNGRIVLAADKTTVSGWGTSNWPQWHPQYSGFIGIVLFTAANAAYLPLTTTKRSVDASSGGAICVPAIACETSPRNGSLIRMPESKPLRKPSERKRLPKRYRSNR